MTVRISSGLRDAVVTNYGLGIMMQYGHIQVFAGTQPASPDEPPSGALLAQITQDGLPIPVPGDDAGGLMLVGGAVGEVVNLGNWIIKGVADGTAGWWRFVAGNIDPGGYSTTACRVDGTVTECITDMPTTITSVLTLPMSKFSLTLPHQ